MDSPATLVCVHAHPDDEALFTAGISTHYGALGYDVVLVTCTNGRLGIDSKRRAGNDRRHDDKGTVAVREKELANAASIAGFTRTVQLGYDDSGMKGWRQNAEPSAFVNVDVEVAAGELGSLFDEVKATVVVTYDENGFYGHPDHIMANNLTRRAIERSSAVQRLYYPVVPSRVLTTFTALAKEQGIFLPAWVIDAAPGAPDESVATTMDVTRFAARKQKAIAAHVSQFDNAELVTMSPDLFTLLFGTEYYQRAWSRRPASGDDTDLFGGL
jgi:LmbE family N-acetylglucosaminyl deacetylase